MKKFFKIVSFYTFTIVDEKEILELKEILKLYERDNLSGLLILAKEGINGTICGQEKFVSDFLERIKQFLNENDLNEKVSFSNKEIFKKLKIKIKPEIVTMGIDNIDPKLDSGIYLDSLSWNQLIQDEDTLIIDTRNHYEVSLGSFKNSINPKTNNFREFPEWLEKNLVKYTHNEVNKKIAMYCTGGIRCEKATSFLKKKGYKNVYHLKGGILNYLKEIPKDENFYKGECYVFDDRVALTNNLEKGSYSICHACGMPLSVDDKRKKTYLEGVQCHQCINKFSDEDRIRFAERQKQFDQRKLIKNYSKKTLKINED